jgi:Uma2 family endonuclease
MNKQTLQFEYMSLDDFEEMLADKPADERWELIGGRVVRMMVGARWEHNYIAGNISGALKERLRAAKRSCYVFQETFYFKEKRLNAAMLPDVIVRCGAMEPGATFINDPTVLVEIVSPGSEVRDRVEKWNVYKKLASLQHYLIVSRDEPLVEIYDRVGISWPGTRRIEGLEGVVSLPALDLSVPMAEIYRDVMAAE